MTQIKRERLLAREILYEMGGEGEYGSDQNMHEDLNIRQESQYPTSEHRNYSDLHLEDS